MDARNSQIRYSLNISTQGSTYPFYIAYRESEVFRSLFRNYPSICIITNDTIFNLFSEDVFILIKEVCPTSFNIIIRDGEKYKTLDTMKFIYDALLSNGLGRDGLIVAFGGGVVGDMTGFAAATFMRGVDYVQIPTTLLAMVDSCVGGKTGINLDRAKNVIGAFYQPRAVFCDPSFIKELPMREFVSGLMEIIKYGITLDKKLYEFILEKKENIKARKEDTISYLIYRSCQLKGSIIAQDEKEKGLRQVLNFGHTIGHAIEGSTGYDVYLHGEAVALGSIVIMALLVEKGVLAGEVKEEFVELIKFFGLPACLPAQISVDNILDHLVYDKKRACGKGRWVTLKELGVVQWGQSIGIDEIRHHLMELVKDE